jgi:hypothetical protein
MSCSVGGPRYWAFLKGCLAVEGPDTAAIGGDGRVPT